MFDLRMNTDWPYHIFADTGGMCNFQVKYTVVIEPYCFSSMMAKSCILITSSDPYIPEGEVQVYSKFGSCIVYQCDFA